MAAQFDSKPDKARPVNQPLIFTISSSTTTPDRFIVQTYEDSVLISTLFLTPNVANKSHFDLSTIAQERVACDDLIRDKSAVIHSYSTKPYTTGRSGMRKYEVKVGTYVGAIATYADATAEVWLTGGAVQISQGLLPSWNNYYPGSTNATALLTEVGLNIKASDNDEGVLSFFNSDILTAAEFYVQYKLYAESGALLQSQDTTVNATNGAEAFGGTDVNQMFTYLGFMPKNLNGWLISPKRPQDQPTWSFYTLRLRRVSNNQFYSDELKINKVCPPVNHERTQVAFTNSIGGWDYLGFNGRRMTSTTQSSKTYKRAVGDFNATTYTFLPSARESVPYQSTASESYELKSADFNQAEMNLLPILVKSKNVMMRMGNDGEWLPAILDTKSVTIGEQTSKINLVSLKLTLAQTIKC